MKKLLLIQATLFIIGFLHGQTLKKYSLSGEIKGEDTGTVYLKYFDKGIKHIDTSEIKNGHFQFSGFISEPVRATLTGFQQTPDGKRNAYEGFYLDPTEMTISLTVNNFENAVLAGSKTNDDWLHISHETNPLYNKIAEFKKISPEDLSAKNKNDSIDFYQQKIASAYINFAEENPNSAIVLNTLPLLSQVGFSYDSVLFLLNKLSGDSIKNTYSFQIVEERIEQVINSTINHFAPDFSRYDVNNRLLHLSDFKDKYVLLDFWASWCIPCRKETPHIKELYKQYHSNDLEIIAIACDSKYDDWRKAIQHDSIELFHNILAFTKNDMQFLKTHDNMNEASFKGELRKLYNLMPIPAQILIDKKGIIIGRYSLYDNTTVEDLDEKLSEIFTSGSK